MHQQPQNPRRRIPRLALAGLAVVLGLSGVPSPASATIEGDRTPLPNNATVVDVETDTGDAYVITRDAFGTSTLNRVAGGAVTASLVLPDNSALGLTIDSARDRAYVLSHFGKVTAVNLPTMSVAGTVNIGDTPFGGDVDPVSGRLFVPRYHAGDVVVLDGPTLSVVATSPDLGSSAQEVVTTPGGGTVFVSHAGGVSRLDGPSFSTVAWQGSQWASTGIALSPDGTTVVSVAQDGSAMAWRATDGLSLASVDGEQFLSDVTISLDGSRVFASANDRVIELDTATLAQVGLVGGLEQPNSLVTHPSGDVLAALAGGGALARLVASTPPDPLPTVSVAAEFVEEGDPYDDPFGWPWGMTRYDHERFVPVTLDEPSTEWTEVRYATGDPGTATVNEDYYGYAASVLIPPGETTALARVTVLGDELEEDDEDFTFTITGAVGATVGDATAPVTILDDEEPPPVLPEVSLASDVVLDETAGTTYLPIYLDRVSDTDVTVDVLTDTVAGNGDNATADTDYRRRTISATIPAGDLSGEVEVLIFDDSLQEGDETFTAAITNAAGATFDPAGQTVTIADDDIPPAVVTVNPISRNLTEGTGAAGNVTTFTVRLDRPAPSPIDVFWSTVGGTAVADEDYVDATGVVQFSTGQVQTTVQVASIPDALDEPNEQLSFVLTDTGGNAVLGSPSSATVTVVDDDAKPGVSISDTSGSEGDELTFTVDLDAPSGRPVSVGWITQRGTTAATDFTAASGTLTFAPGETHAEVTVATVEDAIAEPTETLFVNLRNAVNVSLTRPKGTGSVIDDDPLPTVSVSSPAPVVEGHTGTRPARFTVSLSGASANPVTVTLATSDGTARSANPAPDYTALTTTITFNPGQTSKVVNVNILGDRRIEPAETFHLTATSVTGAGGVGASGTATIQNDD